jgi:hypothetical protein
MRQAQRGLASELVFCPGPDGISGCPIAGAHRVRDIETMGRKAGEGSTGWEPVDGTAVSEYGFCYP